MPIFFADPSSDTDTSDTRRQVSLCVFLSQLGDMRGIQMENFAH